MQLQVQRQLTAEIRYLAANKYQTRHHLTYLEIWNWEKGTKVGLMFWRQKNTMKRKYYVVSGYKQTNKVFLVYLECKQQQDKHGRCILKLKLEKMVDRTYLETSKTQTRCRSRF